MFNERSLIFFRKRKQIGGPFDLYNITFLRAADLYIESCQRLTIIRPISAFVNEVKRVLCDYFLKEHL